MAALKAPVLLPRNRQANDLNFEHLPHLLTSAAGPPIIEAFMVYALYCAPKLGAHSFI